MADDAPTRKLTTEVPYDFRAACEAARGVPAEPFGVATPS